MSLVDSYRRRGKKAKPFPVTAPRTVDVGEGGGVVTTYTYGQDLYDAMLAAIDGRPASDPLRDLHLEGRRGRRAVQAALADAAARGVEVYCIYDGFANLVVSPRFKRFPSTMKVLPYPVYNAGWRVLDLRRYGRDHRKILVVDDAVGFVGGYNIGTAYATEWRDTHVRLTGPGGVGPQARLRRLLEPPPATDASAPASGRCCSRRRPPGSRGSGCTATCRGSGCSRSAGCTSRRSTAPVATSG